jgi:two-component system heavy metal sensor histidine kinase CusS
MSSRSAEGRARPTGVEPGPARLSITVRLSLLFAASSIAILILAGVYLYFAVSEGLYRDDEEAMHDQVAVIGAILQEDPDLAQSPGLYLRRQYADGTASDYILRIRDETGRVLFETARAAAPLPRGLFPNADATRLSTKVDVRPRRRDGRSYLLATTAFDVGDFGARRVVQLAYDASDEVALLRRYRDKALGAILLGSLLATLAAVVVVRSGLQPLQEIRRAAERITADRLGERVGRRRWPREIAELAGAFDLMLERIEESVARLSRFSADLAHELRTPLNIMIGEAEVALSRARSEHEYRDVIESGLEECGRLERMIEELLFLAWTENPALQVIRSPVALRGVVEEMLAYYEPLAEERDISLRCEGSAEAVVALPLFRRALLNLVSNSLKYTPRGGEVAVRLERTEAGALVHVSDSGEGIPDEHLPRVFDRFYRVDSARSRDPGGVGLGLAVVRSIVQIHGGEVSVESKVDVGTRVTLVLPDTVPAAA